MSWLQGGYRKLGAICIILFGLIYIVRDRQDGYDKLDQFQKRLLACTHNSESLSAQLEVINHYKETVEKMLNIEKNTSARETQAYKTKIQYLNAKNDNLQIQLNECKQGVQGTGDVSKLQQQNNDYRSHIEDLESQIRQLKDQISNASQLSQLRSKNDGILNRVTFSTAKTTTTTKVTPKVFVNPEDHEDVNIQPVENPNFNLAPNEIIIHKKPKEPLVFRRGGEEPAAAELLPQEELLKKIKERKAKKENEENVEDFRELQKPDIEEADYKDIDH
ncbi:hypothetical protein M3Y97_00542500 [Aphelenchoides bicaudatus]|nr:hypothetical protein M3Y97_00542500 [Aphelenchoides bicaudatus]